MDRQKQLQFCCKIEELKSTMFSVAMGILKNESDTEDAIQNAVIAAYRFYDDLSTFEKFKPWILKILTMECYKILNKQKREAEFLSHADDILATNNPFPTIDNKLCLWNAVSNLDISSRTAVILFYGEGLSIRDIAKVLDASPAAVKKRLQRARDRLKLILKEESDL